MTRQAPTTTANTVPPTSAARRGFTLIELLVVVGIVALLIAILLPALGGARVTALRTKALVNARTVATSFELYTQANADTYPFVDPGEGIDGLGEPGMRFVSLEWWPRGTIIATNDLFMLRWAWPSLLSSVTPWEEGYPAWVSPGMDTALPEEPDFDGPGGREPGDDISWRLSRSFLGDPALWGERPSAGFAGDDPMGGVRAVRTQEVLFPSRKALLWDTHLAYLPTEPDLIDGHWDAPTPMAFPDGHADAKRPQDAAAPIGEPWFSGFSDSAMRRLHDTPDGVRGADY